MVEFLKENLVVVLAGFSLALEFLILLLKRKPKTLDDFIYILSDSLGDLPSLICEVEVPGCGTDKKIKVLDSMKKLVSRKLGRTLSSKEEKIFIDFISSQIELILSTPQKKGLI